jgi:hypothetical protein
MAQAITNLITCLNCMVTRELKKDERHTHDQDSSCWQGWENNKRHFWGTRDMFLESHELQTYVCYIGPEYEQDGSPIAAH